MDFDTLDATQAIYHDDFDDETDEDLPVSQRKPVGHLRVIEQKGLENKEYPVYEGDNVIGRHESCQICIPSKSLSKEHACITVKSHSHLIYDKGSRNKTKRGKLFLSPDVRYELKHKDELVFADVCCTYTIANETKAGVDSGSETGNEQMEVPEAAAAAESLKNNSSPSKPGAVPLQQSEEEDYASDGSSDILQPTQPCDGSANNTVGLQRAGLRNDEEKCIESNLSSVMETPEFLKQALGGVRKEEGSSADVSVNVSSVMETPDFLRKRLDVTATRVLPESGSETDDEEVSNAPPETLVIHDDDDKSESESAMLGAATQALGDEAGNADETQVYGTSDDDEDRWSGSDSNMMEAATQALPHRASPSPVGKGRSPRRTRPEAGKAAGTADAGIHVEETQGYDMDIDTDGDSKDTPDKDNRAAEKATANNRAGKADKGKRATLSQNTALTAMETQKMEDVTDDEDENCDESKSTASPHRLAITAMETQKMEDVADDEDENCGESKGAVSPQKLAVTAMETQKMEDITDDEDEDIDNKQASKSKALMMMETQKMDDAAEPNAEEEDEDGNNDSQLTGLFETSTLACEVSDGDSDGDGKIAAKGVSFDDATQAIDGTVPFEDEGTVPLKDRTTKQAASANDGATAPVDNSTMPIDSKADDPTMVIDAKEEDATMPIQSKEDGATMPVGTGDATVPVGAKANDATMPIDERAEDATVPVQSKTDDATVPVDRGGGGGDTVAVSDTVAISDTVAVSNTAPVSDTVAVSDTVTISDRGPVSDTVAISDTAPVPDTVAVSDTAPVSDTVAISETAPATGSDVKQPSVSASDTLPVMDADDDATQEFDGFVQSEEDDMATLPVSDDTSGEEVAAASKTGESQLADVGDTVPAADDASQPLFLPQIARGSDVSDEEDGPEMVPESQHDEESTAIIRVPEKSPLKSAMVDPTTRGKSPSPKRVAFAEPDISDDETPPPKSMARGRKKPPRFEPEPSPAQVMTSARGKGRGRRAKAAKSTETSQAIPNQDVGHKKDWSKTLARNSSAADDAETSGELSPVVSLLKPQPAAAEQAIATPTPSKQAGQHSESEPRRSGRARKPKRFADDHEEETKASEEGKDSIATDSLMPHTKKRDSHGRGKKSLVVATDPEITKDAEDAKSLICEAESKDDVPSSLQAASGKAAEVESKQPEPNRAGTGMTSASHPCTENRDSPPGVGEISSPKADAEHAGREAESSTSASTRTRHEAKKPQTPKRKDAEKFEPDKMETESPDDSKMEVEESTRVSSKAVRATTVSRKRAHRADAKEEISAKKARPSVKSITGVLTAEDKNPVSQSEDKTKDDEDADTKSESGKGTGTGSRRGSEKGSTKPAAEDDIGEEVESRPSQPGGSSSRVRGNADSQDISTDGEATTPSSDRPARGRGKAGEVAEDEPEESVVPGRSSKARGSKRSAGKVAAEEGEDVSEADRSHHATPAASKKGRRADEEVPGVGVAHDAAAVVQGDGSSSDTRGRGRVGRRSQVEATRPDPAVTPKESTAKPQSRGRRSRAAPAEGSSSAEGKQQPDDAAPPEAAASSGKARATRGMLDEVTKQAVDASTTDRSQKSTAVEQPRESDARRDTSVSRSSRRRKEGMQLVDEKPEEPAVEQPRESDARRDTSVSRSSRRRKEGMQLVDEKPEEPAEEAGQESAATGRRGRPSKMAQNAERDESSGKESEDASENFTARRGRTAKKTREVGKGEAVEPVPDAKQGRHTRKAPGLEGDVSADVLAAKESKKNAATTRQGGLAKMAVEAPSNASAELGPSGKPARHSRKALGSEKDAKEEDPQPEDSSLNSAVTKRGRLVKKNRGDDTPDKLPEDGSQAPAPTRRGRQAKTDQRDDSTDRKSEDGSQAPAPTRRGRQAKTDQRDDSTDRKSEDGSQTPLPTQRGRQAKTDQRDDTPDQKSEDGSQAPGPTRRGRQAKTDQRYDSTDQKSEDGSQAPAPTRRGRQAKTDQRDDSTDRKSEDGSQAPAPTRRGRQMKKVQSSERDKSTDRRSDSSTQPHSQDSQDPAPTVVGRKGRKSQSAGSEATAAEQSTKQGGRDASNREPTRRGVKRSAASTEHSRGDVAHPEVAESSEGPTPQKRGRKAKDVQAEEKVISTPVAAKRGRQSAGCETPARSEGRADEGAIHSPTLRRTTLSAKPKIIFTGVIDKHGQKIVKDLGGEIAQSVQECTHLVTDKIRRTVKFLGGAARGVAIVTPQWLNSCKSSGMFVDSSVFMVSDSAMEKQYKFSLKTSLQKAAKSPLLSGYKVHVTKSVRPEPQQMKDILQCAGAEWLATMPKKAADKTVVISCEEDKNVCQAAVAKGIDVVSAEFVLTGILKQEVDINSFRLFASVPGSSSSRSRR